MTALLATARVEDTLVPRNPAVAISMPVDRIDLGVVHNGVRGDEMFRGLTGPTPIHSEIRAGVHGLNTRSIRVVTTRALDTVAGELGLDGERIAQLLSTENRGGGDRYRMMGALPEGKAHSAITAPRRLLAVALMAHAVLDARSNSDSSPRLAYLPTAVTIGATNGTDKIETAAAHLLHLEQPGILYARTLAGLYGSMTQLGTQERSELVQMAYYSLQRIRLTVGIVAVNGVWRHGTKLHAVAL